MKRSSVVELILVVAFILFWIYVMYAKLNDFAEFKREMVGQVFPKELAAVLPYFLPVAWFLIAATLALHPDKFIAMLVNFIMLLSLSIYVGLAVFNVYTYKPCDCAGLFDFNWNNQLYFNLVVTAVAGAGLIITLKNRERRKEVWAR
ncbi:MAG: hypothetical protein EOO01_02540 [Chitinophagaceae bacterium]|nr:MAG: hypothetical protein EOO01_02540 [Chitinophagaceae bacterium]